MMMDPLFQFLLTLLSSLLVLIICVNYLCKSKKPITSQTTSCSVPEVGGAWPIIGHMHFFGGQKLVYKLLGDMADNYGPMFTVRLGSHKALVLSSWEVAKECFTLHDKAFSSRPAIAASELLGYNHAMYGFAPYGPYWREMRKITTVELLSNYRLNMFKRIRVSVVRTSIKELYMASKSRSTSSAEIGVLVDMKQWFKDLVHNISFKIVVGRRSFGSAEDGEGEKAWQCQKSMRDFFYLFGVFVLSDAVPSLGWLDIGGYKKAMKRVAKELDVLVGGWLEEHKQRRLLGGKGREAQDFMDVMLNTLEDADISSFEADTIIKATCLNMILAADTLQVPLVWALSLLINSPSVLKKAQEELDTLVGKERNVQESDIENLVYLQAIVKETLRLYPPAPILLRAAHEDCTLSNGYHIAAGTRLMPNLWKIQHDERVWSNPYEFQPERFFTKHKDLDVRGLDFELLPFGSGRRSCPGLALALKVLPLTLASLLHSFEVVTPSNVAVDMTESPGLTNLKVTPLEVLITPRLDPKLYALE